MRKIIQISSTGVVENSTTQCELVLTALCDDGTVWIKDNRSLFGEWVQLPNVPQGIVPTGAWAR